MTRRWLLVSLSIALGLSPSTASTKEETIRIIKSDADYDKIVDDKRPPDPRQVQKLVGYILDGMNRAHTAGGHTQHQVKERFLQRYNRRRKTIEP